jgi:hypothetical protein
VDNLTKVGLRGDRAGLSDLSLQSSPGGSRRSCSCPAPRARHQAVRETARTCGSRRRAAFGAERARPADPRLGRPASCRKTPTWRSYGSAVRVRRVVAMRRSYRRAVPRGASSWIERGGRPPTGTCRKSPCPKPYCTSRCNTRCLLCKWNHWRYNLHRLNCRCHWSLGSCRGCLDSSSARSPHSRSLCRSTVLLRFP